VRGEPGLPGTIGVKGIPGDEGPAGVPVSFNLSCAHCSYLIIT